MRPLANQKIANQGEDRHDRAADKKSHHPTSNRHRGADQWLYAVSGQGVAKTGAKRLPLRAGTHKSGDELPRATP